MRERDLKALEFDKVLALIAEQAVSDPGRRRLAELRPVTTADEVRRRLRLSAQAVELRSHAGALPIGEFSDQLPLLAVAGREGAALDGESLLKVRQFVLSARHLQAFLRSRTERFELVDELARDLLAPKELADALLKSLGDDGALLDDASRELKRLRTRLRDERQELQTRLFRALEGSGMASFLTDHLVTIRNRRFVLPMKPNYAERLEGIVQDRSVSGETLFVEPLWAVELNNRLMMLEREAEAEERRILLRLTAMVRGYRDELRITYEAMVALDALNACAKFAERFSAVEPTIVEAGMDIRGARHPLLTVSGREVVPIDLRIAPERHGLVISGPNTGGKTVALKTLGLFSLMAQAGLLIPAEPGACLPSFAGIFADIGDEQSIEADLSTFSAHIANLADILRSLPQPALVILDEPGAGTDPADGSALTIGLMHYLSERKCLLAIATHSTTVKLHAYQRDDFETAAVDFDEESLSARFRLKPNTVGQSYGLAVARRLGLPADLIARAEQARPEGTVELQEALRRLEAQRAELAEQTRRLSEAQQRAEAEQRRAVAAAHQARERAVAEQQQMRSQFGEEVAKLRREGETVIAEIRAQRGGRRELGLLARQASVRLEEIAPKSPSGEQAVDETPLRIGEQVELTGSDIRGELLAIEPERAVVARGGLRIEVAPSRLKRVQGKAANGPPAPAVTVVRRADEARAEINLIGMRTAEALRSVEDFLDQAYLTSKAEVRIVHGVGSGALRKAIHEYLAQSPYCSSFAEAHPHGGGAGVTLVQISQ